MEIKDKDLNDLSDAIYASNDFTIDVALEAFNDINAMMFVPEFHPSTGFPNLHGSLKRKKDLTEEDLYKIARAKQIGFI